MNVLVALLLHRAMRPGVGHGAHDNVGERVRAENAGNTKKHFADQRQRHIDHRHARDTDDDRRHRLAHAIERRVHDHDHAVRAVTDWHDPHEQGGNVGYFAVVTEQARDDAAAGCENDRDDEAGAETENRALPQGLVDAL